MIVLMHAIMKSRFRLYRRHGGIFYVFDRRTRKRESLSIGDPHVAARLLHAKNEAHETPLINRHIARAYLAAGDPEIANRTWQAAMEAHVRTKKGQSRHRWETAIKDPAFDLIRTVLIFETQPDHFLRVLDRGTVATNVFLRRLHNFAVDLGWLPWPVIPKRQWPAVRFAEKRAIRLDEHLSILAAERNPERRAFYELCWHLGGSQGDIASLSGEDVDWEQGVVSYRRQKTKQRCQGLGIRGVTLHSYRYAWAERAKQCGYPERFAQEALGHKSKAVHRAYAKRAQVVLPSIEEYQRHAQDGKILRLPVAAGPEKAPEQETRSAAGAASGTSA